MFRWLSIVILFLGSVPCYAQSYNEREVSLWYDSIAGVESLGILNGPVYQFISKSPNSHPFLVSPGWTRGDLNIGNSWYYNLLLVYDMEKDLLVMKHPDPSYQVGVSLRLVEEFKLHQAHYFTLNEPGMDPGFYQLLYDGFHFNLVARRSKKEKTGSGRYTVYEEENSYYLMYKGSYYKTRGISAMTTLFPGQKKQIKAIRKAGNYKPRYEGQLILLIQELDQNLEIGS